MTKYIKHPNPLYRGNPLIEGLGLPLLKEQLVEKTREKYVGELDLEGIDQEYHGYYQRTAFDNLIRFHEPRDELYRVYDIQRRMIESGLVKRNPLPSSIGKSSGVKIMELLEAIQKDLEESKMESKRAAGRRHWIKSVNVKKFGFHEVDHSYVLAGLSGAGKTILIEKICGCEEQVIQHHEYTDSSGVKHRLPMKQIYKLYIKVDNRKGQKSTLISILEAVGALVDEPYAEIHKNGDVRELIAAVRKVAIIHGIGLIIFDEAQNLAPASNKEVIGSNERVSMKFLEEIFNHIAVPTFFIGTFSILNIFSKEATIARRAAKDGSTFMASCKVDSPFWKRFGTILFQTRNLGNQVSEYDMFHHHIHYLSAGLPAIAVSLTRAALNYLTYLDAKDQDLSIAVLDKIYKEQFEVLHKPLDALRSRNYKNFEDFEPMYLLESIEEVVKTNFEKSGKVQKVNNLLTGEVKITKAPEKMKADLKSKENLEIASKQLSPESLIPGFGDDGEGVDS